MPCLGGEESSLRYRKSYVLKWLEEKKNEDLGRPDSCFCVGLVFHVDI